MMLLAGATGAQAAVWSGGGRDNNFSTNANWVGNAAPVSGEQISFAGSTRLTPNNDQVGFSYAGIVFNSGASGFVIGGNACALTGDVVNNSASTQTINLAGAGLTVSGAARSIQTTLSGDLVVWSPIANGGYTLTADVATTITLHRVISGGGGLTKSGSGDLRLGAANTYGGGTTMLVTVGSNNYTLTLSATATAVTVAVTVAVSTPVNMWNGGTSFDWSVAGNWSLNQVPAANQDVQIGNGSGGNTLVPSVTAASTCNSITFMTLASTIGAGGGTLTVGSGGITASVTGSAISCPMTLGASQTWALGSNTLTVAGAICGGSNSLAQTGSGTLIQTGTNTYTGQTTVAGTLQLGDKTTGYDGNVVGTIANNGAVVFNTFGSISYGLEISGNGTLTKSGDGTLTLSGASTYTGATTVSAGTLSVTGSTASGSAVTVSNGATLGGTGTVSGTISNTGTIDPGVGVGTLSSGVVTYGNGGILAIAASGASSDRLTVTGNLTLGSSATLNLTGTWTGVSAPAVIASYTGSLSDTFATVTGLPSGWSVDYGTANQIRLMIITRYWVGRGGDNNWTTAANWASASGGSDAGSVPGSANDVVFDGNVGGGSQGTDSCSVDVTPTIMSLTMASGYTGALAFGTNTLTVAGNADLRSGGTFTGTTGALVMGAGGALMPPAATTIPNLAVSSGTTTLAANALSLASNLTISGGATLASGGQNLNVAGNWANSGSFTASGNTVTLNGAGGSTQVISGTTTFNNLSATCTTARTLRFTAGTTQTVGGTLTLTGASGQQLRLRSTVDTSSWTLTPNGTRTCSFVDVMDGINTVGP